MQLPSALDHSFLSTGIQKTSLFDKANTMKLLLSQSQWHKRKESAGSMQIQINNPHGNIHQLQRVLSSNCPSLATTKTYPEPSADMRLWKHMWAFHLSNHLWPAMEPHNSTWIEGDSPIIWTMLHPPADDECLPTYAWNGHLDNFMPWSQGQTESVMTWPILILYTRWNIHQGWDLPAMKSSALQQHQTPTMSMPLTKGLTVEQKCTIPSHSSDQNMVAKISNNVWTRPKMDPVNNMSQLNPGAPTRGTWSLKGSPLVQKEKQAIQGIYLNPNQDTYACVDMSMPDSKPLAEPSALHPAVPTSTIVVMAAILEYLLLSQLCSPGSTASSLLPAGYQYWNHHWPPCQAQLVKSQTSYFRWITAIIQQGWDTAWDLITYQNVEIMPVRVWPTHQSIVVHPPLLLSKECRTLSAALVLTVNWQSSQFKNSYMLPW